MFKALIQGRVSMLRKTVISSIILASVSLGPVNQAAAQDAFVGGLLGGIIGSAVGNNIQRNRTRTVYVNPGISNAQRQQNREIQSALNYFGFSAGVADGVLGQNSRRAVSEYQSHMGYSVSGELADFERAFLFTSYQRARAGGQLTTQLIAGSPYGARGLLHIYRDEMSGRTATVSPVGTLDDGKGELGGMAASTQSSLSSHCNRVNLLTNSNGGYVTQTNMHNPRMALSEQFCLARTYALADGEDLAAQVQSATTQQIAAQCVSFAPSLQPHVAALSLQPREQVLQGVSAFVFETGMSRAQLVGTAKICLWSGYQTDNMDVAIGNAMMLVALGESEYAELLGHHLVEGFGTSERVDLAVSWYEASAQDGRRQVFAPGQPNRDDLILQAAYALDNGSTGMRYPEMGRNVVPVFTLTPQ
jgi:peptidoglycan hydrolase-like protein with peptidoglycan-binding domain